MYGKLRKRAYLVRAPEAITYAVSFESLVLVLIMI